MGGLPIDNPNRQTHGVISTTEKMGHRLMVTASVANAIKRSVVANGICTRQFLTTLHHHHPLPRQSKSPLTTSHGLSGDRWNNILTYAPLSSSLTRLSLTERSSCLPPPHFRWRQFSKLPTSQKDPPLKPENTIATPSTTHPRPQSSTSAIFPTSSTSHQTSAHLPMTPRQETYHRSTKNYSRSGKSSRKPSARTRISMPNWPSVITTGDPSVSWSSDTNSCWKM